MNAGHYPRILATLATGAVALAASGASAQTARNADRVVVGIGAAVLPTFEGADDSRVLPLPTIDIKQGRIFANLADGIGVLAVDEDAVAVGGSIALVGGYRRRDVPDGVERIRFSPGARLFSKLRFGAMTVVVGGTRALGGAEGLTADASLAYTLPMSRRFILSPSVTAVWANGRHTDRYFGISEREAIASGLPRFQGKSGIKNIAGGMNGLFVLDNRLTLVATAGLSRLLNDAAASPINERKWNASGLLGFAYRI